MVVHWLHSIENWCTGQQLTFHLKHNMNVIGEIKKFKKRSLQNLFLKKTFLTNMKNVYRAVENFKLLNWFAFFVVKAKISS